MTNREKIESKLAKEFGVSQITVKRILMSHSRFFADSVINQQHDNTIRIRGVGRFEHISKSIERNRARLENRKLRKLNKAEDSELADEGPFEFE
jgi:hypothetical protein